ncbi:MAG: hypothetical protein GF355_13625, partial [Candidatus Eisenbacteria bacterium]|nr:hypothetical protein [Candidatus Eisenbacteria bacterium]
MARSGMNPEDGSPTQYNSPAAPRDNPLPLACRLATVLEDACNAQLTGRLLLAGCLAPDTVRGLGFIRGLLLRADAEEGALDPWMALDQATVASLPWPDRLEEAGETDEPPAAEWANFLSALQRIDPHNTGRRWPGLGRPLTLGEEAGSHAELRHALRVNRPVVLTEADTTHPVLQPLVLEQPLALIPVRSGGCALGLLLLVPASPEALNRSLLD